MGLARVFLVARVTGHIVYGDSGPATITVIWGGTVPGQAVVDCDMALLHRHGHRGNVNPFRQLAQVGHGRETVRVRSDGAALVRPPLVAAGREIGRASCRERV